MMKARIIRSSKRIFDCRLIETNEIVQATALRQIVKLEHPVVGDYVHIRSAPNNEYEICELENRLNSVFRKIVRTNKTKHIAANVDLILIVTSVGKPTYKPNLLDRYILRSIQWDIPLVVVFNKIDQLDPKLDLEFQKKKLDHLGVSHFTLSSLPEQQQNYLKQLSELENLLKGKTAICLGQSGVGKSKLISALSGGKVQLLSSRLAKGVEKGAHTTTWAEIVKLEHFEIIDSPGIRSLSLEDLTLEQLDDYFPDLAPYFHECKFSDCTHEENSKGCSFHKVDDPIVLDRLYAYLRIKEDVQTRPDWQKD